MLRRARGLSSTRRMVAGITFSIIQQKPPWQEGPRSSRNPTDPVKYEIRSTRSCETNGRHCERMSRQAVRKFTARYGNPGAELECRDGGTTSSLQIMRGTLTTASGPRIIMIEPTSDAVRARLPRRRFVVLRPRCGVLCPGPSRFGPR